MGVRAGHYWGGRRREEATIGEESRRGWWVAGYVCSLANMRVF